jgi:HSP20 family protein
MNEKKKEEKSKDLQKMSPRSVSSPFEGFLSPSDSGFFQEMDRFFDDYLPRRWWHQFRHGVPGGIVGHTMSPFGGKTPSVDVIDREDEILIKAELPGVDKKDINITITNNTLTIEASVSKEDKEEKDEYYRQEICRGSYRRTLELPAIVKEDDAKATFTNGILELKLPKTEKTKRSTITVE